MSPKLPVITGRKLIQALQRGGFIVKHQTGSHVYLSHSDTLEKIVTVPYHSKDLKKGTVKSILRQAGMDVQTLTDLL